MAYLYGYDYPVYHSFWLIFITFTMTKMLNNGSFA